MDNRKVLEEGNFYMEKGDSNTHSLTVEEIASTIDEDIRLAIEGVNDMRREVLINRLKRDGIDPNTVDIDEMLQIKSEKRK